MTRCKEKHPPIQRSCKNSRFLGTFWNNSETNDPGKLHARLCSDEATARQEIKNLSSASNFRTHEARRSVFRVIFPPLSRDDAFSGRKRRKKKSLSFSPLLKDSRYEDNDIRHLEVPPLTRGRQVESLRSEKNEKSRFRSRREKICARDDYIPRATMIENGPEVRGLRYKQCHYTFAPLFHFPLEGSMG